jgi:hypothetical protein
MVASNPETLKDFLKKLKTKYSINPGSNEDTALQEIQKFAKNIDEIKINFTAKSDKRTPGLEISLNKKAQGQFKNLFEQISNNLTKFYKHATRKDNKKQGRDKSLPKSHVEYETKKQSNIPKTPPITGTFDSEDGMIMTAKPLSIILGNTTGSTPTGGSTDSKLTEEVIF